jgi:homoaconitase/3-isopropylmalate dehydratase large subunit
MQVETLDKNCAEFGITEFGMTDLRQGIVHVVGPEQGDKPMFTFRRIRAITIIIDSHVINSN